MKHKLLILLVILISCKSQDLNLHKISKDINYVGSGFIEINFRKPLKIFKNDNSSSYFDEISFDETTKKFKSVNHSQTLEKKINSFNNFEDIKELQRPRTFIVLDISKTYYKILLNETTKETGFIAIDSAIENLHKYLTWEFYLKNAEMIRVNNADIYDNVNGEKINQIGNQQCYFKIIQVEKEWAKIIYTDRINMNNEIARDKNGWIRWRDNETILIRIIRTYY